MEFGRMDRAFLWTTRLTGQIACPFPRVRSALLSSALLGSALFGCDLVRPKPEEPKDPITGLTAAEDREVLAKVGDKPITLGDYARTLARMDEFERLRYQTDERKAELLDELINAELLAHEAEKRGLDKNPEYQARLFLAMRDERLEELRRSLPPLESFSDAQVRAYYDAHSSQYEEPERRRPQVIVLTGRETAEKTLKLAQGANGEAWGKLAREASLDRRGLGSGDALELSGDLGFVSAPGETRGDNPDVPEEVRKAVFGLAKLGEVAPQVVEAQGKFFIVRHGGTSPARHRTRQEAERSIRIELRRELFHERERELLAALEKKYPATINAAALQALARPPETPAVDGQKP
jgi:peptidyl-prolyl cis-trans isomerase C